MSETELPRAAVIATLALLGWEPWTHLGGGYMTLFNPGRLLSAPVEWGNDVIVHRAPSIVGLTIGRQPTTWGSTPTFKLRHALRAIQKFDGAVQWPAN